MSARTWPGEPFNELNSSPVQRFIRIVMMGTWSRVKREK
jgi:hypothetical protein